jgi:hypothetical protein
MTLIPSEARNPSSPRRPRKERFLTSQTPFGMTNLVFFSNLLKSCHPEEPVGTILLLKYSLERLGELKLGLEEG